MAKDTVKTSILIISDTHAGALRASGATSSPPLPLPPADLLIHCGDLTLTGGAAQYEETLDMLARIDAPVKLVIAGNHDLTLDAAFMQSHAGNPRILSFSSSSSSSSGDGGDEEDAEARWKAARALWTDPSGRAAREGVTFLDEGTHRVALANGARAVVHASPYTPEFQDWGFAYARSADRFNAPGASFRDARNVARAPVPSFSRHDEEARVDILVTHGPPWGRLDQVPSRHARAAPLHTGCSNLLRALMRARPLLHCFGHIHEGHGAERIEWSGAADAVATAPAAREEWEGPAAAWEEGVQLGRDGIASVGHPGTGSDDDDGGGGVIAADVSADAESPLVRGRDTLLVNASIMTVNYRPENRPWLIELDLPAA